MRMHLLLCHLVPEPELAQRQLQCLSHVRFRCWGVLRVGPETRDTTTGGRVTQMLLFKDIGVEGDGHERRMVAR